MTLDEPLTDHPDLPASLAGWPAERQAAIAAAVAAGHGVELVVTCPDCRKRLCCGVAYPPWLPDGARRLQLALHGYTTWPAR